MKEFDKWNIRKKNVETNLHKKSKIKTKVKEGNIYWVAIGVNIGREIHHNKYPFNRPVLVVKDFKQQEIFWGVPLTSKKKQSKNFYKFVDNKSKQQYASLIQLRAFDYGRIENFESKINKNDFLNLREILKGFL